jgi:hypothetical protein
METAQSETTDKNLIAKLIDEDGEQLLSYEQIVLNTLKQAKELVCYNPDGVKIDVDYWNAEASNDEGMPDIVIACKNGTTFFYDDLMDGELTDENELIINGHIITIR